MELYIGPKLTGRPFKSHPSIEGILDTGSGINVGSLKYFADLRAKHPELVDDFGEMTPEMYESLRVGGIEEASEGTDCSHYIVLRTPMYTEGTMVTLGIALTTGLACNLIWGLPTLIKSKMIINLWEKYVYSSVFQTTFPLVFKTPVTRDTVPESGELTPAFGVQRQE
jgi:hypothetical protein